MTVSLSSRPSTVDWPALVADAVAAPSAHNTQPWSFAVRGSTIELHLDPARVLAVADPDGREARIGCGAALYNLRLALRARGLIADVRPLPDPGRPDLLATLSVVGRRPPTPAELGLCSAIHRRHNHHQAFRLAMVPLAVRYQMTKAAAEEGSRLRLLQHRQPVGRLAEMIRRTEHVQQTDPRFQAELLRWTSSNGLSSNELPSNEQRGDGVPRSVGGPRPVAGILLALRDVTPPELDRPEHDSACDPLFGVLLSYGDTPWDHLCTGQALQRVLLTATALGAATTMLSQPIEHPGPRSELRKLLGGPEHPQLVLRIGMAATTATTPRRPVSDVIQVH